MILYPALDLLQGKCVRLLQGDYQQATTFNHSPMEQAKEFVSEGAQALHIVNLDGAVLAASENPEIICKIAQQVDVPVQIGGGVRRLEDAKQYFTAGIHRLIIGSAAVKQPEFLDQLISRYPGRIAVGVDVLDNYVCIDGWKTKTQWTRDAFIEAMIDKGITSFIYTDIRYDGTLRGINVTGYAELHQKYDIELTASGGISSLADLKALKQAGIPKAIIGKALYTHQFTLQEALTEVADD